MARYFFGAENPLGRRIGMGRAAAPDMEIVGVVKDARSATLRDADPARFLHTPYMQDPDLGAITFYVRARGDGRVVTQRVDPTCRSTR